MPELPEVETIKRGLEKKIIGLTIQKIQVLSPKSFLGNPKLVEGQKIEKIWRRAKILGMDFSGGKTLLFHLKMSGQLILIQNSKIKDQNYNSKLKNEDRFVGGHPTQDMLWKMPNSHTRVIFSFSDPLRPSDSEVSDSHLYFNDQRKFGWVKIVQSSKLKVQSEKILGKLGPEPLEKGFTWQILKSNLLKHKSQPVKVAIMDQSVVSGVGNIYSNEACFLAKIDPRTKVATLTDDQFQALYRGVVGALREGIKYKGSTRAHFVDAQGRKGYFLDYAKVYWKEGYPCQGCSGKVQKITLGGRGTYFCSSCQR